MEESEFQSLTPREQVERLSSLFQTNDKETFFDQTSNYMKWICKENDPRLKEGGFQSADYEFEENEMAEALDDPLLWSLFFLPRQSECQFDHFLFTRLLRIFCQLGIFDCLWYGDLKF